MSSQKRVLTIIVTTLFLVTLGLLPSLQAAEFSADMEGKTKGKVVVQGKIFVQGTLNRHEMNQEGHKIIVISRPDKGLIWNLMPQGKSYIETAIDPDTTTGHAAPDNWTQELESKANNLGSETVNGVKCNKYELTNEGIKATYWIATKEAFPVRIITSDSEINYRNIHFGRQPDDLFEIPAGYQKFNMPQMPKGMQGGMPSGGRR